MIRYFILKDGRYTFTFCLTFYADCLLAASGFNFMPLASSQLAYTVETVIMINLGLALFDNNNRLITLSGGYQNLHYLTQFIVTVQLFTIKIIGLKC
jgi:hypothetical protein